MSSPYHRPPSSSTYEPYSCKTAAAPSIRAGLSVQDLKKITAMRMASSDVQEVHVSNAPVNLASTYQTATPQQLQAAGILPVVINDKGEKNSRGRARPSAPSQTEPYLPYSSYHHHRRESSAAIRSYADGTAHQNRLEPPHASSLCLPPERMSDSRSSFPIRNFTSSLETGFRSGFNANSKVGGWKSEGPEVRSPPYSSQFLSPEEYSEQYFEQFASNINRCSVHEGAFETDGREVTSPYSSGGGLFSRPSHPHPSPPFRQFPLQKLRSQSMLISRHESSFPLEALERPVGPVRLPSLPIPTPTGPSQSTTQAHFPLVKSKTAPKLSLLDSLPNRPSSSLLPPTGSPSAPWGSSPLSSTNAAFQSLKSLQHRDSSCFLPGEVAESVLDTPPILSPVGLSAERGSSSPSMLDANL